MRSQLAFVCIFRMSFAANVIDGIALEVEYTSPSLKMINVPFNKTKAEQVVGPNTIETTDSSTRYRPAVIILISLDVVQVIPLFEITDVSLSQYPPTVVTGV